MIDHVTLLADMRSGINCRLEAMAAIESLDERIQQLATMLLRWQDWNDDPKVIDRDLEEDTRQLLRNYAKRE